jgi:hypothetical protein
MSIEAAFPLTPTISFISYGKIMFDLRVFYLRALFQERNYRVNGEVAILCAPICCHILALRITCCQRYTKYTNECAYALVPLEY